MEEVWKKINNTKYPYSVSNLGRIKRLNYSIDVEKFNQIVTIEYKEKELIGNKTTPKGYKRVNLIGIGVSLVHRLVAEHFIPNPNNYEQINHIDGNKLNNSIDNLEWVTNSQNRDHAVKNNLHTNRSNGNGLSVEDCLYYYNLYRNGKSIEYISKELNYSKSGIYNIFRQIKNKTFHGINV